MLLTKIYSTIMAAACWEGVCIPGVGDGLSTAAGVEAKVLELLNWAFGVGVVLCTVFIIYGGIQFITSNGDAEKVESGTATIKNAAIGLAVIMLAGLLINAVYDIVTKGGIK